MQRLLLYQIQAFILFTDLYKVLSSCSCSYSSWVKPCLMNSLFPVTNICLVVSQRLVHDLSLSINQYYYVLITSYPQSLKSECGIFSHLRNATTNTVSGGSPNQPMKNTEDRSVSKGFPVSPSHAMGLCGSGQHIVRFHLLDLPRT